MTGYILGGPEESRMSMKRSAESGSERDDAKRQRSPQDMELDRLCEVMSMLGARRGIVYLQR